MVSSLGVLLALGVGHGTESVFITTYINKNKKPRRISATGTLHFRFHG
jgi:hypothetical protein